MKASGGDYIIVPIKKLFRLKASIMGAGNYKKLYRWLPLYYIVTILHCHTKYLKYLITNYTCETSLSSLNQDLESDQTLRELANKKQNNLTKYN